MSDTLGGGGGGGGMGSGVVETWRNPVEDYSVPPKRIRRQRSGRPTMAEMIMSAIRIVGVKRKGASTQKIKQHIYSVRKNRSRQMDSLINRQLVKLVKSGQLIRCTGVGACGFFRLGFPKGLVPSVDVSTSIRRQSSVFDVTEEADIAKPREHVTEWGRRPLQPQVSRPDFPITAVMDVIDDVTVEPLVNPHFVKPCRLNYKQNDIEKTWELVTLHDSVSVIVYNTDKKKLILVRQFRPAVYYSSIPQEDRPGPLVNSSKYPGALGLSLELCAGIVDKTTDLTMTARHEVLEECGYDVPLHHFQKVLTYRSGVGVSGDRQTTFYVEVTNKMKVSEGGGLASEGEFIEVVEMSVPEVQVYLSQPEVNSPGGLLFGLMWFLQNKAPKDSQ